MRRDIGLELRSTIEDMLPDDYQEADVKAVLDELGNPVTLANGYKGRPGYLIGPRYYDLYVSLLKIVIPIVVIVVAIASLTQQLTNFDGDKALAVVIGNMLLMISERAFETAVQVFFGLTVAFAIIDRFDQREGEDPLSITFEKWTADDLKHVTYIPPKREISTMSVFWRLLWTAVWVTGFFYANQLFGIYEGSENELEFIMPALNQDVLLSFWPVVIGVAAFDVALSFYKLYVGQWTKKLAIFNGIVEAVLAIGFIVVILAPNLLNEAFITYMTDILNLSSSEWDVWFIGALVVVTIFGTIFNIYDGFKKSNASKDYQSSAM